MDDELRRLFHAVADLSPKERETYFREQQVPAEIQAELNSLLEFDSDSGHLLTEPIVHCAEMLLEEAAENNLNLRRAPGDVPADKGRSADLSCFPQPPQAASPHSEL